MTDFWTAIGGISAFLAALAIVAKWIHTSKWAQLRAQTRSNLSRMGIDWVGVPPRPGFEGRPSFPERTAVLEQATKTLQHEFATETMNRLEIIGVTVNKIDVQSSETTSAVARLDFRVNGIDARMTDEIRRGEERAAAIRDDMKEALEKRAEAIEKVLSERNEIIDHRLDTISNDLLRGETYRASLVEMGLPIDERGQG